ncbi:hypothetical protein M271_03580 [Streptomyces rapamycinicus NRRL 5491]|uniref:Uncharacterized protein n=1 Tax=Streptomyces rapamycinicus TaxID=1226757 RepID=A0ABR6LBV7_9ACTN|nr:hypothetical protein M271_03580 [Streptomyces rapamycinicus NRRL 5491]MBB4779811.1 hypothetical protein [Streptomyces rapamycinicus]
MLDELRLAAVPPGGHDDAPGGSRGHEQLLASCPWEA